MSGTRVPRGLLPLSVLGVVVVLVTVGLARGLWLPNAHNGLLALAFTLVGAYVAYQRPGHPESVLFLATGGVHALMFHGRQIGHAGGSEWWAWTGVWPVAVSIALTTLSVIHFPDGRLPSTRWRPVVVAVLGLGVGCSILSALWPVEYTSSGLTANHPWSETTPEVVSAIWSAIAHPAYVFFQVLWPIAIWLRWRSAGGLVRRQLAWVMLASTGAAAALAVGLIGWQTPRFGLLAVTLVPVVAGLAIVHSQHAATYAGLSWLSRRSRDQDLPTDLARATSEALDAPATLWMGTDDVHAIALWPPSDEDIPPSRSQQIDENAQVRRVAGGLLAVSRATPLSLHERRLFDDLAAQAEFVLEHLSLRAVIEREQEVGHLDGLSPRESDVLALIAEGMSNQAICDRLFLSIKTVEPIVSSIFTKLQLHNHSGDNRRVLAALAYTRRTRS